MSTLLCLVRHGESEWNLEKRIQGQSDPNLSELGHKQAIAVAERLAREPWDLLYSSDLARARVTAEYVAQRTGLPVRVRPGLRERSQGKLEGMLSSEAKAIYPDFDAPEVGRETQEALKARAAREIAAILDEAWNKRLIVVSHGGLIRAYLVHLAEQGIPVTPVPIVNTAVTLISWSNGRAEVLVVNDASHLDERGMRGLAWGTDVG